MPTSLSTAAPAQPSYPALRRSLRALTRVTGTRIKLKPRRDALTRVRHDLRSSVQSVMGYADLLQESRYGALTAEQQRFVHNLRGAAEQLQELVDTCVELSRPSDDAARTLDLPLVQVGQLLRRVQNGLLARGLCCDLTVSSELETRCAPLDVAAMERALCGLAAVLTREGAVTLVLRASLVAGSLKLVLSASDAAELPKPLLGCDAMEDQLGNRDFVRLKLAEVLLGRLGFATGFTSELDYAELSLPL